MVVVTAVPCKQCHNAALAVVLEGLDLDHRLGRPLGEVRRDFEVDPHVMVATHNHAIGDDARVRPPCGASGGRSRERARVRARSRSRTRPTPRRRRRGVLVVVLRDRYRSFSRSLGSRAYPHHRRRDVRNWPAAQGFLSSRAARASSDRIWWTPSDFGGSRPIALHVRYPGLRVRPPNRSAERSRAVPSLPLPGPYPKPVVVRMVLTGVNPPEVRNRPFAVPGVVPSTAPASACRSRRTPLLNPTH
jgi:hypothetical protein